MVDRIIFSYYSIETIGFIAPMAAYLGVNEMLFELIQRVIRVLSEEEETKEYK